MKKTILALVMGLCAGGVVTSASAEDHDFPGDRRAALALTYDDALDSHLDTVLPALDRYGFKATFYLTIERPAFANRIPEWQEVAAEGHELGNHTLYHPCIGSKPDHDWVVPEADLDLYTVERMRREVVMTNMILKLIDGEDERSFAYPCGESAAGGESYVEAIAPYFVSARGVLEAADTIDRGEIDFSRLATYSPSGVPGEELIAYAEEVLASGGVGTITFHGIGAEYLSVSAEAHEELLAWLDEHRDEIWVDTVKAITLHLKEADTE